MVNCFVISTVLIVLMVANMVLPKLQKPRQEVFVGILISSLLLIYLIPWQRAPLGSMSIGLLLLAAYSIPLFCAGILFTDSFRKCEHKSRALGANLFGAMLGGVAQNLSFIVGLKALLIIAAIFYAVAWLSIRRTLTTEFPLRAAAS
jgi:hypothetical protein